MSRFKSNIAFLALAVAFILVVSSNAVAQSSSFLELSADNAIAEASINGLYPAHVVVPGSSLCYSQTANGLWARVDYNGPATTLYFVNTQPGLAYGLRVKSGSTVLSYLYTSGGVGTHTTEVYTNGISATVQYTIKPC
jgi:hypothetical protein